MPSKLSQKDRMLFLGAGIVFLALITAAVLFGSSEQSQGEDPTTYSTAAGGAKAAFLLLSDTGYKIQRWERPLGDLPIAANKTLILAEPNEAPTRDERDRLRAFLAQGGRVIATGMFAGTFLPDDESVPDPLAGMTWKKASTLSPSRITRAAAQITLSPRAYWGSSSNAYPLYGDGDHTLVVKYAFGRGEVLWWAAPTPLTNAGLREQGNLEFFLACLDGTTNEILWDEYIHGYRQTLGSSIVHSPVKWLFFQVAVLAFAVLATFSRRSGPTCLPATEVRLSPIEFVQTLGGLYERAGAAPVAVDICYRRFRYWVTRRLGVAGNTSPEELASAIRDRLGITADDFAATLKQCESAASDPFLQPTEALHLLQELDRYAARLKLFQAVSKEKG